MASQYKPGMRIEITGQSVKAENGTFEVTPSIFPAQPNGDDYWQYRRILPSGKLATGNGAGHLRGHRASWLDANARIIVVA